MTTQAGDEDGYEAAMRVVRDQLARTDTTLHGLINTGTGTLGSALAHLSNCRGKLLRPLLTLASGHATARARGQQAMDRCVQAAAAVELLHLGTLCHDDVMDDADTRRGAASINAKWGNSVAILSGDVLIARAISTVAGLGPAETRVLVQTLEDLCEGQTMETRTLFDAGRSRADYLRCVELKTASLFSASSQLGALAAGASLERSADFAEFGRSLGVAFQIVDDILDVVGSEQTLGKAPGSDIRAGVLTLPAIEALHRAPELRGLLSTTPAAEQVAQARSLIIASGAVEVALADVRRHIATACQALAGVSDTDLRFVAPLTGLAQSVIERGLSGVQGAGPEPLSDVVGRWRSGALTPNGARSTGGHR